MHPRQHSPASFKRQVVFRIGTDDWPLLEQAAGEHGSIQAAILAGLRSLATERAAEPAHPPADPKPRGANRPAPASKPTPDPPSEDPEEEIRAREAAQILGLKTSTVSGYIRSGRLPGRYDSAPTWRGWLTTRGATEAYRQKTHR